MNIFWSFALPAIACVGLWLLNNKRRGGWALNAAAQVLWAWYGLSTHQWGYTAFAGVFFGINLRGYLRWKPATGCTCTCTEHRPTKELA